MGNAVNARGSESLDALLQNEQDRRQILEALDEGLCVIEVVVGDDGTARDARFLEVNRAFEQHTGLVGAVGRTIREMVPSPDTDWIDICGKVALTGVSERREHRAEANGRAYDVRAFRIGAADRRHVAVLFTDVSGRKRTEEALSRSQAELAAVFGGMKDAAAFADHDRRIIMINPAFTTLFGYSSDEVIGRTTEFFYPTREAYLEAGRRRYHSGSPGETGLYEVEYRRKDGSIFWAESSGAPVQDADGRIIGFVSVHRDVTERRRIEDALRRERESYRTLAENLPAIAYRVFVSDARRMQFFNRALPELSGYTEEELTMGDVCSIDPLIVAEDRAAVLRAVHAAIENHRPFEVRYRLRTKAGELRHFSERGRPVYAPDGTCLHIDGVIFDVTASRLEEERARQRESRLRLALEAGRMGTCEWTMGAEQAEWSAGLYALLGYKPGEVPANEESFRRRLHPDDVPLHEREMGECMKQRRDYRYDFRTVWEDGSVHWLSASGRIVDHEGGSPRMYGVVADIDDIKRTEQQLEYARAVAESANKAKDRFIAVLSHELRTPLTPSVAALAVLRRDPRLPPEVRGDLAMISRNLDLEVRLIGDLLDVSRVASGKLSIEKDPLDVAAVIRQAAAVVGPDLDARSQTLSVKMPGAPYPALGDAARLQQVFWNLLRNAMRFSPDGNRIDIRARVVPAEDRLVQSRSRPNVTGDLPTPEVTAADDPSRGKTLVVEVADQGRGISADMLDSLFDYFVQGPDARAFGGLGLGLAISKGIVELHGGTIAAASRGQGKGATFTVILPLAVPPLSSARAPSGTAAGATAPRALRILLVEDHVDTANVMKRLLELEGHAVTLAGGVDAGSRAARRGDFDLLVSDLSLPDGTGYDLMRTLRAAGMRLSAIAVSGYGTPTDIENSLHAGFAEHITKPVSFDVLRRALDRVATDLPRR